MEKEFERNMKKNEQEFLNISNTIDEEKDGEKKFVEGEDDNNNNTKKENINQENKNQGFFSKINNYRKSNTGLFFLIIFSIIIGAIITIVLSIYVIRRLKSHYFGYTTHIDSDLPPKQIGSYADNNINY